MILHLKKAKSSLYSTETIIDTDDTDNQALLTNTPPQEKSQLRSLEQTAGRIDLYVNANKTEYIYFRQKEAVSSLSDEPLQLMDPFTNLGANILAIESNVNIQLVKAWNVIDKLSVI